MNKKIICIGIISMFLSVSFSAIGTSISKVDNKDCIQTLSGGTTTLSGYARDCATNEGIQGINIKFYYEDDYPHPFVVDVSHESGFYFIDFGSYDLLYGKYEVLVTFDNWSDGYYGCPYGIDSIENLNIKLNNANYYDFIVQKRPEGNQLPEKPKKPLGPRIIELNTYPNGPDIGEYWNAKPRPSDPEGDPVDLWLKCFCVSSSTYEIITWAMDDFYPDDPIAGVLPYWEGNYVTGEPLTVYIVEKDTSPDLKAKVEINKGLNGFGISVSIENNGKGDLTTDSPLYYRIQGCGIDEVKQIIFEKPLKPGETITDNTIWDFPLSNKGGEITVVVDPNDIAGDDPEFGEWGNVNESKEYNNKLTVNLESKIKSVNPLLSNVLAKFFYNPPIIKQILSNIK